MGSLNLSPPAWNDLAKPVQDDLSSKGFDAKWFVAEKGGGDEEIRLAVLNLYAKLRRVVIGGKIGWSFVDRQLWTAPGSFGFATDENNLKEYLHRDRNFADPDYLGDPPLMGSVMGKADFVRVPKWDSRELCAKAALHFRGEAKKWAVVHIDPDGLAAGPGLMGKLHPTQWAAHWVTYTKDRWNHVEFIRSQLISQGYPKQLLEEP